MTRNPYARLALFVLLVNAAIAQPKLVDNSHALGNGSFEYAPDGSALADTNGDKNTDQAPGQWSTGDLSALTIFEQPIQAIVGRTNAASDGNISLSIGGNSANPNDQRGGILNTRYTIREGDHFQLSFDWKDGWSWNDSSNKLSIALFTTDDNTLSGTLRVLAQGSYLSEQDDSFETISLDQLHASGPHIGQQLWLAFGRDRLEDGSSFAFLDKIQLSVTQSTQGTKILISSAEQGSTRSPIDQQADFEAPAYVPGQLLSDPDWSFDANSLNVQISTSAPASGQQSLQLTGASPFELELEPLVPPGKILWLDLNLKPLYAPSSQLPLGFSPERSAVTGFVQNGPTGEIHTIDGDGQGSGQWLATGSSTALSGNQAQNWQRLTYRLDYSHKTWDLYVDNQLIAAELGFLDDSAAYLSRFSLLGAASDASHFDNFTLTDNNPLYPDTSNDGLPDSWLIAQGLDHSIRQRGQDPDNDGLSTLQEYLAGTRALNADSDGDGMSDGDELTYKLNPLRADVNGAAGLVRRDVWTGLNQWKKLHHLTDHPNFPQSPSQRLWVNTDLDFRQSENFGDRYGQRIHGLIVAPESGPYTFWISGDDYCELWLSPDARASRRQRIARVDGWSHARNWDQSAAQQSAPVQLQAGQSYYFEILHKEGTAWDHVAVAWQYGSHPRRIISAEHLRVATPETGDADQDGLPDAWESANGLDPAKGHGIHGYAGDLDSDGLPNYKERQHGTRADLSDTDSDGLNDTDEIARGTDPLAADSDGDTLPDGWEHTNQLNPLDPADAKTNPDGDSYNNLDEYRFGTDPQDIDSDDDGLRDGQGINGTVQREIFYTGGAQVKTLYAGGGFPRAPDRSEWMNSLESERNIRNWYGSRIRGYIVPTVSGDYTFHVSGDDQTELWLSADSHGFNAQRIASVTPHANYNQWNKYPEQTSAAIPLVAGQTYAFEVVQSDATGGDHIQIGWSRSGGPIEIIPAANLRSWAHDPLDADDDGLEDAWETANGLDPTDNQSYTESIYGDADRDGILTRIEQTLGLNPLAADSDGDGYVDNFELSRSPENPLAPNSPDPAAYTPVTDYTLSNLGTELQAYAYRDLSQEDTYLLSGSGNNFNAQGDSGHFMHKAVAGDFRIIVKRGGIGGSRNLTLMARESLAPDARMVVVKAFRNQSIFNMRYRLDPGSTELGDRAFNVNYSGFGQHWFRLDRRGNDFIAYASRDGVRWTLLGAQTMAIPKTALVGLMASSGNPATLTELTCEITEFRVDTDRDGLWNDQEAALGTSSNSSDSDGDGYSDYDEINEYHSDPNSVDLGAAQTLANADGSASVASLGDWVIDGSVTYALGGRGAVEYELTLPQAAIYRLSLLGQSRYNNTAAEGYDIAVEIDGVKIGKIRMDGVENAAGYGRILTPWLKAGVHRVRFFIDNTYTYRSLEVQAISAELIGGDDLDNNGTPDWMQNRLKVLNGVDNIDPATTHESPVSPFCLEGRSRYLAFSDAAPVELNPLPAYHFYADVPLDASADVALPIHFENNGKSQTATIRWVATDVLTAADLTIRKGDSLLLTAIDASDPTDQAITITIGSAAPVNATESTAVEHRFDTPGSFNITATVGALTDQLTVTVLEAALGSDLDLLVNNGYDWSPQPLSDTVALSSDANLRILETTVPGAPRRFNLLALNADPAVLAARLPGDGAVLGHVAAQGFQVFVDDETHVEIVKHFKDGDALIHTVLIVDNIVPGMTVDVLLNVSGGMFPDGSRKLTLSADDFDELGRANLYFIGAAGSVNAICHQIHVSVDGQNLGAN